MELPKFRYSPNAYKLNLFKEVEGICSICGQPRKLKYISSFYSIEKPDYICPWCIANGEAAKKYDGSFNDYCGIEGVSPDPNDPPSTIPMELLLEITNRTPSYPSWQQEVWLSHCNEPCAFIGFVDTKAIESHLEELKEDIQINLEYNPEIINHLTTDRDLVGCLFRCLKCGKYRLHIDCT